MFMDFIREHRGGHTHDELTEALRTLVAAVTDEGKGGTLTLTVAIKPFGKGDGLEVAAEVKVKPPKEKAGTSIFFATPENDLSRKDPKQKELELREIAPSSPARSIA